MYGVDFNLRAQIFAARGFVVLCANPRGTPGYGEVFGNLLRTRDPGDDFDDLMRGVDFVAAKGYIDTSRLAVAGGLVAAWAIGHTDRFRRAVVERLSSGRIGPRWEDPDHYVKHSPIFFAREFPHSDAGSGGRSGPRKRRVVSRFAVEESGIGAGANGPERRSRASGSWNWKRFWAGWGGDAHREEKSIRPFDLALSWSEPMCTS